MTAVDVLTLKGALPTSVAITLDVLAMANRIAATGGRSAPFEVRLVGSGRAVFEPFLDHPAEPDRRRTDVIVVPAQGLSKEARYRERLDEPDVADACACIRGVAGAGGHVASSCTGTLVVARTGVLDGRRATTAWWLAPVFGELFPSVRLDTAELVLTDGPVTTAGAALAQMDLTVGLIARYAGAGIADACARRMILDERRSQVPYMALGLLAASDESVAKAVAWARARLGDRIGVDDLARAVGQSPRTFSRRVLAATGLSPIQFLQRLRVERAVELIETTALPFEEIAYRVGYADPSTLRALVRRGAGLGPRDLRARVRSGGRTSFSPGFLPTVHGEVAA